MKEPIHNKEKNLKTGKFVAKKRVSTVVLVKSDEDSWKMFHCPDCRNPIAQYKGDWVMEIPGEAPKTYPVQIQCKNPKCGRKIVFKDSVSQE